ncbi:MAG: SusC/RagA family TonB-linked outer membrane protein, partial [Chitinophagaceae bacterium]
GRNGLPNPDRPYFNLATLSPNQPSVSGGITDFALAGFFGRFNYSFKNTYFFEASARYEGSSRFSQLLNKQRQIFGAVSAGWTISNENFMKKVSFINYAKIRTSYGTSGNQNVSGGGADPNYVFNSQISPLGFAYYPNNTIAQGSVLLNLPNESLQWETSAKTNFGLDVSMFKNKLSFTFDVYTTKLTDMIIALPMPSYIGFLTAPNYPSNASSMINRGWEFSATYRGNLGKVKYSVTGNLSDVRNEVLDTKGLDIVQGNQITRAGHSIRSYQVFLTDGLYQVGDNFSKPYNATRFTGAGDIKYRDLDGNDTINTRDRVLVGNNFPRYDYSLNINLEYKGFDLNVFLFGVGMRDNYISGLAVQPFNAGNWIAGGLTSALDRWTSTKTNARLPRLFSGGNGNYVSSDYWLMSGAFMRVKHINVGYSLPKSVLSKLKIEQLRFYFNAVNPFTISNYEPGFDPEIANQNGSFYPIMKTYTLGLNLKF